MKKLLFIISLLAVSISTPIVAVVPAVAQNDRNAEAICRGSGGTWDADAQACNSADGRTVPGTINQITNVLIFIIGAIAVLMIIVGGLRYVLSSGDQSATAAAKNTILYAVIGLVVAIMAYAIVNFVFDAFNIR